MRRSEQRILTTHTGSLPRPTVLLEAGTDQATRGTLLRDSVGDVVRRQLAVGLDVVNDGEFGKSSWAAYVLERISGFEIRHDELIPLNWLGRDRERFAEFFAKEMPNALTGSPTEVCVGPITYQGEALIQRDLRNLRAALPENAEAFFTAVAPASTGYNARNEYYASDREYVYAIADALKQEYHAIIDAGLLLQVDDAVLANMFDYLVQQSPEKYRQWAQLRVDALNHALAGIPEDRVRYHVCFGSWHVPHVADAPLEEIIDLILQVRAGAYSLEAANPRHEHEWRVWQSRRLPDGKLLIPGIVTHHLTTVEHPRLVADRIIRFANLVGKEQVIAGTDCGFAQSQGVQRVHPTVMWAKFAALVEGARLASNDLWS
ncbi:MAG TPA: cobalamin-independent methionine synthase II family protein [Chloroflexota bacterium]|nr:cobalamin-independent methionine synthase II family protein [Chloroflexota bacterium]